MPKKEGAVLNAGGWGWLALQHVLLYVRTSRYKAKATTPNPK